MSEPVRNVPKDVLAKPDGFHLVQAAFGFSNSGKSSNGSSLTLVIREPPFLIPNGATYRKWSEILKVKVKRARVGVPKGYKSFADYIQRAPVKEIGAWIVAAFGIDTAVEIADQLEKLMKAHPKKGG